MRKKETTYIQTFYIPAGKDVFRDGLGWRRPEFNLMSWALSCLLIKETYGHVTLFANSAGEYILRTILELPYDKTDTRLDKFPEPPRGLWALPKIYTYSLQEAPFIHIDGDVFLFGRLPENIENGRLVAQNPEIATEYYTETQRELIKEFTYFPDAVSRDFNSGEPIKAVNAGILGGKDTKFIQKYAAEALKYVRENIPNLDNVDADKFNVFFEQHLFRALADMNHKKIEYIFSDTITDNGYTNLGNFHDTARLKYLHTLGHYKRDFNTCMAMAATLRNRYPQYYYKIINLFQTHKNQIFTDFYEDKPIHTEGDAYAYVEKALYTYHADKYKSTSKPNLLPNRIHKYVFPIIEQEMENTFGKRWKEKQEGKVYQKFKTDILRLNQTLELSDEFTYGCDIDSRSWLTSIDKTDIKNIQLTKNKGVAIIDNPYNFGAICLKQLSNGVEYYDSLDARQTGNFHNLIIPSPYFGIDIYDIDDVEAFIIEQLATPQTIKELLKTCETICESDVLTNHHEKFEQFIRSLINKLIRQKAICPHKLNQNTHAEITVSNLKNILTTGRHQTDDNYDTLKNMQPLLNAFARNTNSTFYIFDYTQKSVIYITDHQVVPFDNILNDSKHDCYNILFEHIPQEEHPMLKKIAKCGNEILSQFSPTDRLNSALAYTFHFDASGHRWLLYIKKTPILLRDDGSIWLALFDVSFSHLKDAGQAAFWIQGGQDIYILNNTTSKWISKPMPNLSNIELQIIRLTLQGHQRKNISDITFKSPETIKSHIKSICAKLGSNNIQECSRRASILGLT